MDFSSHLNSTTAQTGYPIITNDNSDERIDKLQAIIENLSTQIQFLTKMKQNTTTQSHSKEMNYKKTSDRKSHTRNRRIYDTCWYHYKFKKYAKRCVLPCNFAKNQGNE